MQTSPMHLVNTPYYRRYPVFPATAPINSSIVGCLYWGFSAMCAPSIGLHSLYSRESAAFPSVQPLPSSDTFQCTHIPIHDARGSQPPSKTPSAIVFPITLRWRISLAFTRPVKRLTLSKTFITDAGLNSSILAPVTTDFAHRSIRGAWYSV